MTVLEHILGRKEISEQEFVARPQLAPAALTDRGCERPKNEDRYLILQSRFGLAYFVFDGMGGEPGGEAAAQLSVDTVKRYFQETASADAAQVLRDSLTSAHDILVEKRADPEYASMGTTVVGALFHDSEVLLASAGDSRAYHIHGGQIEQLTHDHTLVQQLVDQGEIRPEEALVHPKAHVLTRCLGSNAEFELAIAKLWIEMDDEGADPEVLLLCSDGLYSLVSDEELREVVMSLPPSVACTRLVQMARERGGFDNITAVVIPIWGRLTSRQPTRTRISPRKANVRGSAVLSRASVVKHVISIGVLSALASIVTAVGFVMMRVVNG